MIKKELFTEINDQMNHEFESAHIYLAMASYCANEGLEGFENWFRVQYEEEVAHALKLYEFINSRGEQAIITGFDSPKTKFTSLLEVLETALKHEEQVTANFAKIAKISLKVEDHTTYSFIQWYIDEQVEEEDTLHNLISKVKLVKDAGLYLLDKDLLSRTFVPL